MSDVERLILSLEASTAKYEKALAKAKKKADADLKKAERRMFVQRILAKIPFVKYFVKNKPPKIWPPTR